MEDNNDAVFNILETGKKPDMFFIKGIASALIANHDGVCSKGEIVLLYNPEDIYF